MCSVASRVRRELLPLAQYVMSAPPANFVDLMHLRKRWAEDVLTTPRPGLAALEDKLAWHDFAIQCGVPRLQVFARFGDNAATWTPQDMEASLKELNTPVCVKPSHLTTGHGVYLVNADGTYRAPSPTGPGAAVMAESERKSPRQWDQPDSDGFGAVANNVHSLMTCQADDPRNAKPLREVPPRAYIEELVENLLCEVRVLTVFGGVVASAADSGDKDSWPLVARRIEQHIHAAAQALATHVRSDMLRADFLVLTDGTFVLNEACAWLWPEDGFFSDAAYAKAHALLMQGYRDMVVRPRIEICAVDDRTWRCTENYAAAEGANYQVHDVHFYIVEGADVVAVVDGGLGRMSCAAAVQYALGSTTKRVIAVLTHGHGDHYGGVGSMPIYAHRLEEPRLRGLPAGQLQWVEDGDVIDLGGGTSLRVLHTPGHTSGSISLATDTALFVGDAFLDGSSTCAPMYVADPDAFACSLERLANEAMESCLLTFTGHGATGIDPARLGEAAVAFGRVAKQSLLRLSRETVLEKGWHREDVWSWVEWDDWLAAPVVQAGRDFSFVKLTECHDK